MEYHPTHFYQQRRPSRNKAEQEWTPSEVDILTRYWKEGTPIKLIAKVLTTRSVKAITAKARDLQLTPRGHYNAWTEEDKVKLIRLWHEGLQVKHIERRMGRSKGAIMAMVRTLGFPRRRGRRGEQTYKIEIRVSGEVYDRLYAQASTRGIPISRHVRQLAIKGSEQE